MTFMSDSMGAAIVEHFRGHDRQLFVGEVIDIISQLKEYWPLTVRQVFYQLVAALIIENSQNRYQSISRLVTKLRRLHILPWESIQDRTRRLTNKRGFEDINSYLRQNIDDLFNSYDRCLVQNQENYVEIFTEKDALAGIIEDASWIYCVRIVVCRGHISATFLNDYAVRAMRAINRGQKPVVLYFGDLDPSGARIPETIGENLHNHHGLSSFDVEIFRVALNQDHVEEYQLPRSIDAIKTSDPNYNWYFKQYGNIAVELDSLHPDKLQELVRYGLGLYLDIEDMQQQQTIEHKERDKLKRLGQLVFEVCKSEGLIS